MTADDVRARAIEAGARALGEVWVSNPTVLSDVAAVVDAVEPIIRAAERGRIFSSVRAEAMVGRTSWSVECLTDSDAECPGCLCTCHIEAEVRERLRAQVEAQREQFIRVTHTPPEHPMARIYDDILALLDGESNG
jgi:hypothetical protein